VAREKSLTTNLAWLFEPETWRELRALLLPVVRPIFVQAFLIGAHLASQRAGRRSLHWMEDALTIMRGLKAPPITLEDAGLPLPELPFDFEAVNDAAFEVISGYTDTWWQQFSQSTQESMRRIIARAQTEGLTMPEIIDLMEPLFGPDRARVIAVTETTRLMGLGAQETYRNAGFTEVEWRTVRDARVDIICEELDGQRFPMDWQFEPAHVNCRCFIVPAGDPTTEGALFAGFP
jgi:SPP1 gp7 family putative phage head morphogenesis protein